MEQASPVSQLAGDISRSSCVCDLESGVKLNVTPRSAGWWLVAGLIWREKKILLDGWLVGGWADFA